MTCRKIRKLSSAPEMRVRQFFNYAWSCLHIYSFFQDSSIIMCNPSIVYVIIMLSVRLLVVEVVPSLNNISLVKRLLIQPMSSSSTPNDPPMAVTHHHVLVLIINSGTWLPLVSVQNHNVMERSDLILLMCSRFKHLWSAQLGLEPQV